jgi:hypothetical protein
MKANPAFAKEPLEFWANIKLISQSIGYTNRKTGFIKVFDLDDIITVYKANKLNVANVVTSRGEPTDLSKQIMAYSAFRAFFLDKGVKPNLMKVDEAKALFYEMKRHLSPKCDLPMNKQKQQKKDFAFLTGLVNMLIECNVNGLPVDYNPQLLTSIAKGGAPVRTLSRRVDGAFPSTVNPIAIWEIKEYYYTTTFGSRVADGVYETQLDGYELTEIRENIGLGVEHYLIVDDYFTWWVKGKSYLCRICDMMHMGTLTEALFGKEVIDRIPQIVKGWLGKYPQEAIVVKSDQEIEQDFKKKVE